MVDVVQLVRMLDCDSGGRGFEPRHSPINLPSGRFIFLTIFFITIVCIHLDAVNSTIRYLNEFYF
jgi:hypothetical protein